MQKSFALLTLDFAIFVDKDVKGFLGSGHYHRRTGPVEGCFEFPNKE